MNDYIYLVSFDLCDGVVRYTHSHTHTHTHPSDPNDVIVPPKQYALIGQPYTFNCSSVIPNQMSFVSWLRSGETGSILDLLITSSAQLSDEGVYICRVSVLDTSFEMPVQVGVVGILYTSIKNNYIKLKGK